ncbi:voltage-gated shaker-like K+ channel, subunit [Lasiosphaeria ovina]|uniref:Voltage-gated shaker-like K+ channel, subunit n=1 Tax=Lasiosphaeria ovina TaxID=92902 RepID=A0AAE0KHI2_9PEZI|nr:voltage-gated shaker-like K+ channel, subunit [Lasiosphaeria ovina]
MPPALPITGFGLLGMTWRPKQTPDEQAFAAMRAAVANGATVWSTASAYGYPPEPPIAGLLLIRRYFDKYPEDADKVTLFVRGCFDSAKFTATTKRAEVLESFEESQRVVGEVKKIDVFGPARMDANVPVEETVGALKELVDAGKISSAGLSEVSAATIRRASAVTPISMVEIEFSLWSTEMLTNGVAAACKEHNVAILAYAPLGYGFLVGQFTKVEDLPKGDVRLRLGRFQPDNFSKNLDLVEKVKAFAARKGNATPAQVALAWVRSHSNTGECGAVIPIPGATAASRVNENCSVVELSAGEKAELDAIIASFTVVGHRQIPGLDHNLWT